MWVRRYPWTVGYLGVIGLAELIVLWATR